MSDEKTIRILAFTGKKEDWNMWSEKFMAKASIRGFDEILEGTLKCPKDDATNLNKKEETAKALNKIAFNELVLSATDNVTASLIKSAKYGSIRKGDAHDAWNKLKAKYEPNTGKELLDLNKEYMALDMKVSDDPEEFITELSELRSRMKKEPFNQVIEEQSYLLRILNGLPSEYENVVERLEELLAEEELTVEKVKETVRSKYKRLKSSMGIENEDDIALASSETYDSKFKKAKGKGFKGTCRICGKYGHKASDCWFKDGKNPKNNRNEKRFTGKCNYCGIIGHKERDCRKKKAALNKNNENASLANEEEPVLLCYDIGYDKNMYTKLRYESSETEGSDPDDYSVVSEYQQVDVDTGFSAIVKRKLGIENEVALIHMMEVVDDESDDEEANNEEPNPEAAVPTESRTKTGSNQNDTEDATEVTNNQTNQASIYPLSWNTTTTTRNVNDGNTGRWPGQQEPDMEARRRSWRAYAKEQERNHPEIRAMWDQAARRVENNEIDGTNLDDAFTLQNMTEEKKDDDDYGAALIAHYNCNKEQTDNLPTPNKEVKMGYYDCIDHLYSNEEEEHHNTREDQGLLSTSNTDTIDDHTWIGDTGASTHMTNDDQGMYDCEKVDKQFINVGNGEKLKVVKRGKKRCTIEQKGGQVVHVVLENVNYVPKLTYNLFSITQTLNKGWKITNDGVKIILTQGRTQIKFDRTFKCPTGQLIGIRMRPMIELVNIGKLNNGNTLNDWHQKLSHACEAVTKETAKKMKWKVTTDKLDPCVACMKGKFKQTKISKTTNNKAKESGERLFIDISSMNSTSLGGSRYMALVVDDFSGYEWGIFLKNKSDLHKQVIPLLKKLRTQKKPTKYIRCDNAGENVTLQKKCLEENLDIQFEFTAPYSPQYNGRVERPFADIWNKVRTSLIAAGIPKEKGKLVWTECASTVVKINNILIKRPGEKSASERMFKNTPAYAEKLRTFGEIAIIRNNTKIKSKLESRGIEAMFVGYPDDHHHDVYRFLNMKTGKIVLSRNYQWTNKSYGEFRKTDTVKESYEMEMNEKKVRFDEDNLEAEIPSTNHHQPPTRENDDGTNMQRPPKIPREIMNLNTSYNNASELYMEDVSRQFAGFALSGEEVKSYPDEPSAFQEAWHHPDPVEWEGWRTAIRKEFHDMIRMKVWRRIKRRDIPSDRRVIGSKWVFKRKRDGRFRARLCGLGYTQIAGIDFTANHAPVVNDVSFRIMLVLKLMMRWSTAMIDVSVAFLNGEMEELIFMELPEGLDMMNGADQDDEDDCVILDKCIYGTVQAARQWSKKFRKKLMELGFDVSMIDPCIMIRQNESGTVLLSIYVDDVCLIGDKTAIDEAIKEIEKEFDIRKEGPLQDYLGCIIEFGDDEATIYQPHILKKLREKFHDITKNLKHVKTPSPPGSILKRPTENEVKLCNKRQELYRSGVGTLLYLTKQTRPDIANSVREHSKMMDGATKTHFESLLRLIKYVLETQDQKLQFKLKRSKVKENLFYIVGYSDSDYASDKDNRRSITGMVIYLCGIPIAWKSKGQKAVTLSSTEAEYYALSELCSELIFIKHILEFVGVEIEFPIVARVDNVGAMFLSNNHALSQRTKHISTRQHFIRQFIEDGIIKVIFVRSKSNDSDLFTKNLSKELFNKHKNKIMYGCEDNEDDNDND